MFMVDNSVIELFLHTTLLYSHSVASAITLNAFIKNCPANLFWAALYAVFVNMLHKKFMTLLQTKRG